jgi:hypothetical protein
VKAMAIKTNMINLSQHTQSSSKTKLEYLPPNSIVLDLPFVLTLDKKLTMNMPYLLLEGNHSIAVRLLEVSDADAVVYLRVQELQSLKTYVLSWNLNYEGSYWIWSLADLDTLQKLS